MYDAADSAVVIDGAAKVILRSCHPGSDVYIG